MKIKSKKSFTIIESLIAIFILEIGILGISNVYANSFKTSRVARNETIASNLASGLLDEGLANSYDSLTIAVGTKTRYSTVPSDPFYEWEKKVDVAYVDANLTEQASETNMKKIVVTIYWKEGSSDKNFQIATIKAKH